MYWSDLRKNSVRKLNIVEEGGTKLFKSGKIDKLANEVWLIANLFVFIVKELDTLRLLVVCLVERIFFLD